MGVIHIGVPPAPYPFVFGPACEWKRGRLLRRYGGSGPVFVLSSRRAWRSCGRAIVRGLGTGEIRDTVLLDDRERQKSLATVEKLARDLVRVGAGRDAILVVAGGGVVGDVGGFVAATYLRGVRLVHIPTTLVAQVDSSIGGKTGVNLPEGKNLIGAFYQPRLVLCDPAMLRTLPRREFRSGVFEIIKYAILGDARLFKYLERNLDALLRRNPQTLAAVIPRCVRAKAEIVVGDERESGQRELLNLGHTLGHALETATSYKVFLHGEAVGWGLLAVALASIALDKITVADAGRIVRLLARMGSLPALPAMPTARIWRMLRADKKARGGGVRWVIPAGIGRAEKGVRLPERLFFRIWAELPTMCARCSQ
jgi:3-dehydroquinate synthase